jgi:Domain of unknown function (DUF4190)
MDPEPVPPEQTGALPYAAKGNGMAVASFVTGLLGLVLSIIPILFYAGIVLDVVGIVLGAIGRSRAKEPGVPHRGLATAGLVMGVVGIIVFITWIALIVVAAAELEPA